MLSFALIPWRSKSESAEDNGGTAAVSEFRSEIDQIFNEFFADPFSFGLTTQSGRKSFGWVPTLDVSENENEVTIRAEVPGVDPDDLDISVSGDYLTLSGEKKEETEERKESFYRSERRFGQFRRQVALPSFVDKDDVSAEYRNGTLTVKLKKTAEAKPRRIPVSVSKK